MDDDGLRADSGAVGAVGTRAYGVLDEARRAAPQEVGRGGRRDDGACGGCCVGGGP